MSDQVPLPNQILAPSGPPSLLVREFRRRLRDLRTECGDPSAAQMIRAIRSTSGPRLSPSTLSEFISDKRPLSLPSQQFVEAFVSACLRSRGDSAEEIVRQVWGWLSSRTGIVVALGTGLTTDPEPCDHDRSATEPAAGEGDGLPDPHLVCDPEELGTALRAMLRSADHLSVTGEDELAARLDIPRQHVSDILDGQVILDAAQWDEILDLLQITHPQRGHWRTAGERVRRHALRCRCLADHRHSPVHQPAEDSSTSRADARTRQRRAALVTVTVLGFAALLMVALTSGLPRFTDSENLLLPGTPCPAGGEGMSLMNHHSKMYLNDGDRPQMGVRQASTALSAQYVDSATTALPRGCLYSVAPDDGDSDMCAQATATGDVTWGACDPQRDAHHWVRELHWNDGEVVWERWHLVQDQGLCLQQASSGGVGTPLSVAPCSSAWLQQWLVTPKER